MVVIKGLDETVYRTTCETFGPLWFSDVAPSDFGVDVTLTYDVSIQYYCGILTVYIHSNVIAFNMSEFKEVTII